MPTLTSESAPRSRKVTTTTEETQPIEAERPTGFGGGDWEDILQEISAEDLPLYELTVYRRQPTNDGHLVKLGGSSPYPIERIDGQWIMDKFGGGTYQVKIYEKRDRRTLFREVKIDGAPKISPFAPKGTAPAGTAAETAAASSNGDIGRLCDLLEKVILDRASHSAPQAPSAGAEAAIGVVAEGAKKVIEMVASNAKTPPASPLSDLENLAKLMALLRPQESDLDKLLKQKLIETIASPKKSLLDEVEGLIKLRDLLGGEFGGGKGGDWKSTLIETVGSKLPDALEKVGSMFEARKQTAVAEADRARTFERVRRQIVPQPPAPLAAQPGAPAARQPAPLAAQPEAHSATGPWSGTLEVSATANESAPPAGTPPPHAESVGATVEAQAVDNFVKTRVVQLIAEGAEAGVVIDFIDSARPDIGVQLTHATKAQVRAFLENDPILSQAKQLPNFDKFFEEFCATLEEDRAGLPAEPIQ